MNTFQWIALPPLLVMFGLEVLVLFRGNSRRGLTLVRAGVWFSAAVAIARPELVQFVATSVGIGTGANLVSYLVAIAFVGTTFYFYSRHQRQQQQFTQLVRYLAIREAQVAPNRPHAEEVKDTSGV